MLPVRVRGVDASGAAFEELAHTLNLTTLGVRLGSIRRQLNPLDTVIVFYRQRRMEFKVIWTKLLDGRSEYQVGLQVLSHAKEGWAANLFGSSSEPRSSRMQQLEQFNDGKIMDSLKKLWRNEEGQDIAEYSVMLAVVLVIVMGTVRLIGSNATNVFSNVASGIQ